MIDPSHLSPLVLRLLNEPTDAYQGLVVHGSATAISTQLLPGASGDQLLKSPPQSLPHAQAVLAAMWLWHDGLEECHQLVQNPPFNPRASLEMLGPGQSDAEVQLDVSATYNFWHAIMHRREGDFSNSKYWYHRAASHPILPAIGQTVGAIVNQMPADKSLLRLVRGGWSPDGWVDLVEEADSAENDRRQDLLINIQQIEWRLLFEHCVRMAAGA